MSLLLDSDAPVSSYTQIAQPYSNLELISTISNPAYANSLINVQNSSNTTGYSVSSYSSTMIQPNLSLSSTSYGEGHSNSTKLKLSVAIVILSWIGLVIA